MKTVKLAAAALAVATLPALAAYPEKPITFVVPFTAGGDADLAGRNLGQSAQALLKQPIVVVNQVGASGAIGAQRVKDAAPDGYTLLIARVGSNVVLPALKRDNAFKWNDFTFLGLLELNPVVCVVHPESPYKSVKDLGDAVKSNPGKLNYSSSGVGTILHLGSQLLLQSWGLLSDAAAHVAYKGGNEAVLAVMTKDVQFSCGNLTSAIGQLKAGKLRALVVTTPERVADIPDVPTAKEAGVPKLEAIVGWSALYGPPNLPREVVARWTETLAAVAKDPKWIEGEAKIGSIPRILPPAETAKYVEEQFKTYEALGRALGVELK